MSRKRVLKDSDIDADREKATKRKPDIDITTQRI